VTTNLERQLSGLRSLIELNEHELVLLEELTQGIDNPAYTPKTYGELFKKDEAIEVFGQLLPLDVPQLANAPITVDDYRSPVKRVARALRTMTRQQESLEKAVTQLRKKAQRKSRQLASQAPGGMQMVRSFAHHQRLKRVHVFSEGEAHNSIVHSKRGSVITVGIELPLRELLIPDLPLADVNNAPELLRFDQLLKRELGSQSIMVLDHSNSLLMALGVALGHDKIVRNLTLTLSAPLLNGQRSHSFKQEGLGAGQFAEPVTSSHHLATPLLSGRLSYSFKVTRYNLDAVLDTLELIKDLPIYRGMLALERVLASIDEQLDEQLEPQEEASPLEPVSEASVTPVSNEQTFEFRW
jgi:hypothetical protein